MEVILGIKLETFWFKCQGTKTQKTLYRWTISTIRFFTKNWLRTLVIYLSVLSLKIELWYLNVFLAAITFLTIMNSSFNVETVAQIILLNWPLMFLLLSLFYYIVGTPARVLLFLFVNFILHNTTIIPFILNDYFLLLMKVHLRSAPVEGLHTPLVCFQLFIPTRPIDVWNPDLRPKKCIS